MCHHKAGVPVVDVALRDFLYPTLELKLVLARRLDVDTAAAKHGTLSATYREVAARIRLSTPDAQRLNVKAGDTVQVKSKTGEVVVQVHVDDKTPEGVAIMSPGPYANTLLPTSLPHQGTPITIKPVDAAVTLVEELP